MKSKAIQQLLTVTALAWAGQGQCQQEPGAWDRATSPTNEDVLPSTSAALSRLPPFSAAGRAAVASWVRHGAASAANVPLPARGEPLSLAQMMVARSLPPHLVATLQTPPQCVDVVLGNRLVRLERATRRVVDSAPQIPPAGTPG